MQRKGGATAVGEGKCRGGARSLTRRVQPRKPQTASLDNMLNASSRSGAHWVNHQCRLLANQDLNNRTKRQIKRLNQLQFGLRGSWSA